MFCQKCGKQLADGAKFCTACGQPVAPGAGGPATEELGPEQTQGPVQPGGSTAQGGGERAWKPETGAGVGTAVPPAGPGTTGSMLSGKKHRGKAAIGLLAAAAVVVVVLVVLVVNLFSSLGKGGSVYLYATDDNELVFLDGLKEDSGTTELSDEASGSVYFSSNGKYIYFFEQDPDEYSSYADLYVMEASQVGKDGARPQRVSSKVSRYQLTVLDGGGVLFAKESGSGEDLYYFDGESDTKLADEIYSYTVDSKEQYVYYTQQDEKDGTLTLCRVSLKEQGGEEELLDGADTIFTPLDAEILLYGQAQDSGESWTEVTLYDVYSVQPGQREEKLVEDACYVRNASADGGKLSFTYMTRDVEEHTLYDFVTDSTAADDAGVQEPSLDDFVTGYSDWGWEEYDWEAYSAAQDAWAQVENRAYMRERLKESEYDLISYTFHCYEGGEDTVLAAGLSGYPAAAADAGLYIYGKTEQEVSAVVDLSQLSYYGDIYDYIAQAETAMYQNVNGVEAELDLEDWTGVSSIFSTGSGQAVLYVYGEDEEALVSCKVENNALVLGDVLEDDDFSVCYGGGENVLYYFSDLNGDRTCGNFTRYQNGEADVLAKDACGVIMLEDGTVFKMEDVEYLDREQGSLYVVSDGKDQRIADEVTDVLFLASDRALYVSDSDLYLWEKGESTRLARDVIGVWASGALPYDTFSL